MAHIEIDGEPYDLPTLDTITLDEERLLYIYADTVVQDFIPAHPESTDEEKALYQSLQLRKIRNPEFKKALAHIAYKRANPDADDTEIQRAIGLVNALSVDIAMLRGDDDDPDELPDAARQREEFQRALELNGFWESYRERFGPSGREPRTYWDYRVGNIEPWCAPDRVGELRPSDLLRAVLMFEALYVNGDDG